MTQTAFVTKIIDSKRAEVLVQRGTACGGNCETCGGACSDAGRLKVVAFNRVGASEGDRVKLHSRSSRILSAAVLVYILPLCTFFLAYAIASLAGLSESLAIVSSLIGLALGLLLVVLLSRKRRSIEFEIIERL